MKLWELIRERREAKKMTQKELAEAVGCSPMHISIIERPYEDSRRTASDDLLRKLAKVLSDSEADRIELEKLFLIEKAKLSISPEVADLLDQTIEFTKTSMPVVFLERLRADLERDSLTEVYNLFPKEVIENVLSGKQRLSQKEVIELANALKQDIEEYLLLAGVLPENVKKLLYNKNTIGLFRSMSDFSPSDLDTMINIFNGIINSYKESKKKRQ